MSTISRRVRRLVPFGPGEPTVRNWPIGIWTINMQDVGDGTGGTRTAGVTFTLASAPRLDALMYNLEQLFVADDDNVTKVANVRSVNLGILPEGDTIEFALTLAATTGVDAAAGLTNYSSLPLLLGAQLVSGVDAELTVTATNVTGEGLRVKALGYVWDSRALSAPGGPRRPPGSVFG